MNFLITGSAGFVGTKLQTYLSSLGHQVFMTDRIKKSKNNYFKHNLGFDEISVLIDFFRDKKIETIIHLAAAKGDFMLTQKEFYDDNVRATASLIELIKELDLKNVIHYSTVSVYGHNNILKDENAELKPNNPYGLTKLKSEELLLDWQRKHNTNLTILRPSVIYGENNYANMYNLMAMLSKKIPITVGSGNYIKSLIALENLIDITIFVSNKMSGIQIYNCTDEPYPTLDEIMTSISMVKGFRKPIIKIPIILALIVAFPVEILAKIIKKDLKITRERVLKFSKETDYRSDLLRKKGYVQRYRTSERLQNMAKWYQQINYK
jgi:nucleoside-diphosphate-sugar epimerase